VRYIATPIIMLSVLAAGCSASGNILTATGATSSPASPAGATRTQPPSTSPPAPAATSPAAAQPVPVLGQSRGVTEGYGSARPAAISTGGDPTGILTNVSWQSWGGSQAIGTGTGYYDPPNVPVDQSRAEQATIVAFDLGTCGGQYMYRAVEWYFPASGGTFNASTYLNICAWTYHPSGGP
jgi:hypothetical protein